MVPETVENVLKVDCFAWNVKSSGDDGDKMMNFRGFELKGRFFKLLIDGKLFHTQKSEFSGHGEMADGNVNGFVDFVDMLELISEIEEFRLFGDFHRVDLHDVPNRIILELLVYF